MIHMPKPKDSEVPRTARSRVRLPERFGQPRFFAGWGPELAH
jgi:hypothetical protein